MTDLMHIQHLLEEISKKLDAQNKFFVRMNNVLDSASQSIFPVVMQKTETVKPTEKQ